MLRQTGVDIGLIRRMNISDLIDRFETEKIPLSIGVLDMIGI